MTVPFINIWHAGFYADQRDSRQVIRQVSEGRRVLDLCTYSGDYAACVSPIYPLNTVSASSILVSLTVTGSNQPLISQNGHMWTYAHLVHLVGARARDCMHCGMTLDTVFMVQFAPNPAVYVQSPNRTPVSHISMQAALPSAQPSEGLPLSSVGNSCTQTCSGIFASCHISSLG